jgi:hypothetical protein
MTENVKAALEENEDADEVDSSFLEYLAAAEDLVNKCPMRTPGDLGIRMMHLTNSTVIFGMILVETPDSFIVAFPSTLVRGNNGRVNGRLIMETTQTRFLKSSIITISKPSDIHMYYYLRFLIEDSSEIPAMLSGKRLAKAYSFMSSFRDKTLSESQSKPGETSADEPEELEHDEDRDFDDVPSRIFAPYRKKTRH